MKLIESSIFNVMDKPLDAFDVIRKKAMSGDADEEPLYICNLSDIIEKYANWQRCMPRVIPFYGKLKFHKIPTFARIVWKQKEEKNNVSIHLTCDHIDKCVWSEFINLTHSIRLFIFSKSDDDKHTHKSRGPLLLFLFCSWRKQPSQWKESIE